MSTPTLPERIAKAIIDSCPDDIDHPVNGLTTNFLLPIIQKELGSSLPEQGAAVFLELFDGQQHAGFKIGNQKFFLRPLRKGTTSDIADSSWQAEMLTKAFAGAEFRSSLSQDRVRAMEAVAIRLLKNAWHAPNVRPSEWPSVDLEALDGVIKELESGSHASLVYKAGDAVVENMMTFVREYGTEQDKRYAWQLKDQWIAARGAQGEGPSSSNDGLGDRASESAPGVAPVPSSEDLGQSLRDSATPPVA